jgi:LuxR family maltose regulon positive regulatory protein
MEGHIAAARANYFCVSGDFDQVITQAKLALSILPETETILRARCLTLWGVALGNTQNSPAAIPIFEQALLLLRHANKPGATMFTAAKLAGACLFTGQMHYLRRICMEALEVAETSQAHLHQQSSTTAEIYSMLSRVHAEWGENDQAIEFARKGLALSEHWGHQAFICTCLFYLGRALVFHNDMEQARRIFQRTTELAVKVSPWLWQEIALLILDSLLDGDPTLSIEILSQVHLLEEHGVSLTPVLKARLLLRESKPDEALIVIEEALAGLNNKPAYNTIRYVALSALAHRAMGDENRALALLQQALEFGEAENRVASFVREGEAMEKLLQLAQAKAMTPQFVQRLLEAFEARRTFKPQSNIVSEALIEPLSEREMDILKLLAQGCSDKVIAKTLVIAPDTVHKHLGNIYNKLDVHRRTEAIARARELDLL